MVLSIDIQAGDTGHLRCPENIPSVTIIIKYAFEIGKIGIAFRIAHHIEIPVMRIIRLSLIVHKERNTSLCLQSPTDTLPQQHNAHNFME